MFIIRGGRACGKTTWLLIQSAMSDIPIMTTDHHRIFMYKDYAKRMGLKIPEPILWKKQQEYCGDEVRQVLIDDAEYFLDRVLLETCRARCVGMTTGEPVSDLSKLKFRIDKD